MYLHSETLKKEKKKERGTPRASGGERDGRGELKVESDSGGCGGSLARLS